MSKHATRRRRTACRAAARTLVIAAALIATLSAGQALAVPDEHALERQGRIDRQAADGQADEQPTAGADFQQTGAQVPRRFIRPEAPVDTSPRLDNDQLGPIPAPKAPDNSGRVGLAIVLGIVALPLALGAAATWRIHRRPRPEPT